MNWYILFVRTGEEEKTECILRHQIDLETSIPFIPMHEMLFKKCGQFKKEIKPLFPSYVFIESELPSLEFYQQIKPMIYHFKDIIRVLRYGDTFDITIRDHEREMLMSLCNDERCIESSYGFKEGNQVYITEGPLKGRESIVRKIDRHRKKATIEMEFMGEKRLVSVGLEIVGAVG